MNQLKKKKRKERKTDNPISKEQRLKWKLTKHVQNTAIEHRKTISWVIKKMQIKPYYDIIKCWPGALIKELPLLVGRSVGVTTLERCLKTSAKAEGMPILWYRIPLLCECPTEMCANDMYKRVCSQIWDMPGQYCLPQISLLTHWSHHWLCSLPVHFLTFIHPSERPWTFWFLPNCQPFYDFF